MSLKVYGNITVGNSSSGTGNGSDSVTITKDEIKLSKKNVLDVTLSSKGTSIGAELLVKGNPQYNIEEEMGAFYTETEFKSVPIQESRFYTYENGVNTTVAFGVAPLEGAALGARWDFVDSYNAKPYEHTSSYFSDVNSSVITTDYDADTGVYTGSVVQLLSEFLNTEFTMTPLTGIKGIPGITYTNEVEFFEDDTLTLGGDLYTFNNSTGAYESAENQRDIQFIVTESNGDDLTVYLSSYGSLSNVSLTPYVPPTFTPQLPTGTTNPGTIYSTDHTNPNGPDTISFELVGDTIIFGGFSYVWNPVSLTYFESGDYYFNVTAVNGNEYTLATGWNTVTFVVSETGAGRRGARSKAIDSGMELKRPERKSQIHDRLKRPERKSQIHDRLRR